MSGLPITSAFNDGYIAEAYEAYRRDPASVDESWRQFFRFAESLSGAAPGAAAAAAAGGGYGVDVLRKAAGAGALVAAIRRYGHFAVPIDPLGTPPIGAAELTPEYHGITEADLYDVPASALGESEGTAADVVAKRRAWYQGGLAYEFVHVSDEHERLWIRAQIEAGTFNAPLTNDEKMGLLRRLSEVEGFERFLGLAFVNAKRFSIEGVDALVPMVDEAIGGAARHGARTVVLGMAHRGRLNVLRHVMGKPAADLFAEFAGERVSPDPNRSGDVKYHLGYRARRELGGAEVALELVPNPSHLELVNPVMMGAARALERNPQNLHERDERSVLPICVHGDAAFPGEGVVAETFNLALLRGYRVGGTLHIITNNQVGFTTDPTDARSTHYASDLAKGFEVPIVHVNADDIEACIHAVRLSWDYRRTYHRDVVIDLIGYRRFGHNETDEPSYTQPLMYQKIRSHPTARELYLRRLVAEGHITEADGAHDFETAYNAVAEAHKRVKATLASDPVEESEEQHAAETQARRPATRVARDALVSLNEQLISAPPGFHVYPKLAKQLERRRAAVSDGDGGIDWGTAESLAFASLLLEGHPLRLSGQDTQRGTFSQRHLVFHDDQNGAQWIPMEHLVGAEATFEVYNSPLSEVGCLGFEFGYSAEDPTTTVMWEAQYGDFFNNAQLIVDQFISSSLAKWGQRSRLVLLLPHGYEGNGPEHSSARLERFLQLSAHGNMRVANVSTAAQYFHLLRDQALATTARPLVVMTPKSLLRLKDSACTLDDLADGEFRAVIDDPVVSATARQRKKVKAVLLCTGKIYYELELHPDRREAEDLAIVRVEMLNPLPIEEILALIPTYPNLERLYWVQEEPANMGAWLHLARPLGLRRPYEIRWDYIGRPPRASPSEGSAGSHRIEQERIIAAALAASPTLAARDNEVTLPAADDVASIEPSTSGKS
jgi:2-oxoglutarate dehydrogenase E1 component